MYQVKTLFKAKTSIVIYTSLPWNKMSHRDERFVISPIPKICIYVCLYLSIGFLLWLQISTWQKFPTRELWVSFSQMSLMLTSLCPSLTLPWCFLLVRRWKKWQTLVSWAQHPPCHARCLGKRHLCKWVTSLWPTCTHNTPLNLFCFFVKVHPKMKTVFYKLFQTWEILSFAEHTHTKKYFEECGLLFVFSRIKSVMQIWNNMSNYRIFIFGLTIPLNELVYFQQLDWMNMMHLCSALVCIVVHPKRFTIMWGGGGLSSTTTSVQHPLGWYNGCHMTTAPVRPPHTSHTPATGGEETEVTPPTLYEKCHGIFIDHRYSGPRFNVSCEKRILIQIKQLFSIMYLI